MSDMLMSATWTQTLFANAAADPFLPAATALFFCAVVHALCAPIFARAAHRREAQRADFKSAALHLLGEVEAVFGLWSLVLFLFAVCWPGKGWAFAVAYLESGDYAAAVAGREFTGPFKFLEPLFVFIVMAMASTRPVVEAARRMLNAVAGWFGGSPAARWMVVLTVTPLAGSLITEPAAMTIAAYLLAAQFYCLKPSSSLKYATLALLFVNVSIGVLKGSPRINTRPVKRQSIKPKIAHGTNRYKNTKGNWRAIPRTRKSINPTVPTSKIKPMK